jgi:hypothetical protein
MVIYGINELWLKNFDGLSWFFNGYCNDILAPGILLSYSNMLLIYNGKKAIRSFWIQALFILFVGGFWEYVTPLYKPSTPDPYDILMYMIGSFVYWISTRTRSNETTWRGT